MTAQSVQEETAGLNEELCLLPLTGPVGMELCQPPLLHERFSTACAEPSKSQTELSSEDVEDEGTPQGSMVSCPHQHAVIIIIITHQGVFLVQVHSQPVGGGSDPPKQPHTATVKSEFKAMTGEQMLIESSAHNSSPSPSCF